ncbi:DUF6447 family protein [Gammaproteobacteria bacterium]|nr:DUF6447 family protein [Gammaproteobacteria bacterium]
MTKVKIDDSEYDVADLSEDARAQIVSLQFVDSQLNILSSKVAAYQTAKVGYARALKRILDEQENGVTKVQIEDLGDIITFD